MSRTRFGKRIVLLVLALYFFSGPALAAPVYKWQDEQGVVHFSSKKPSAAAKPAKLPEIMRGEVKVSKRKLISCSNHGGIDCQAGPDADGSVVCYDGFRGASPRYRFSCSSPKLEITEVSDPGRDGAFTVFVRNSKAVEASLPAVFFRPEGGREVKLTGPERIEPFGMAEFRFAPPEGGRPSGKVTLAHLNITCANCP